MLSRDPAMFRRDPVSVRRGGSVSERNVTNDFPPEPSLAGRVWSEPWSAPVPLLRALPDRNLGAFVTSYFYYFCLV
jgi:hypothetical protein